MPAWLTTYIFVHWSLVQARGNITKYILGTGRAVWYTTECADAQQLEKQRCCARFVDVAVFYCEGALAMRFPNMLILMSILNMLTEI